MHGMDASSKPTFTRNLKTGARIVSCFVLFFLILEVVRVTAGPNWHTIVPGQLYRSSQLSEEELLTAISRFDIKTIINLRGKCPWEPWYQEETCAVQAMHIQRIDLNLSAYLFPAPQELQRLLQTLESAPRPILIHCKQGADRTGLTSVLALLHDQEELPFDTARRQLSMRAGHLGIGRVKVMGEVLDRYSNWLQSMGATHSRAHLKNWVFDVYRPGRCWASIEPVSMPEQLIPGEPHVVRVRVRNLSAEAWHFQQASNLGMHLRGYIQPRGAKPPPGADPFSDPPERRRLAAGFMNTVVQPNESIELDVALPAFTKPGPYTLYLDIYDEQMRCFGEAVGSSFLKRTLEIKSAPLARR